MFIISYISNLITTGHGRIFTSFAVTTEKHMYPLFSSQELLHQAHATFQELLQGNPNWNLQNSLHLRLLQA